MNSSLRVINCHNNVNFVVKCVNVKRTTNLTKGKKYQVVQLGMDGTFKVRNNNGRYAWYAPDYFNYKKAPANIVEIITAKEGLFSFNFR